MRTAGDSQRLTWLVIGGLVGVAAALRLVALGRESLWLDEAISYLTARLSLSQILNNTVRDPHPPFYYMLLHVWLRWVPDTDVATRFLSLFLNLLLIPLLYQFVKDLFGRALPALVAVLLVVLSPFHLLYSHELRMYTLLMFLVTLLVWAYWHARTTGHWFWWLLFAAGSLTAIYTHLFALCALVGVGLHALIHHRQRRALWLTVAIGGMLAVLFMPWVVTVLGESQYDLGSLRPLRSEPRNPLKPLTSLTFVLFGLSNSLVYSGIAFFLALATTAVSLLERRKVAVQERPAGLNLALLVAATSLGVPLLVYLIRPFFLPERTMAAASPFLIILFAWGVTRLNSPLPYLVGITAVVMLAGSLLYLTGDLVKPPYRAAIRFVERQQETADIVVHTSDGSYLPALRYTEEKHHVLLAGDPDPRKPKSVYQVFGGEVWPLEQIQATANRFWLVVALEHSVDWQQAQVATIQQQHTLLAAYDVSGIQVHLYRVE